MKLRESFGSGDSKPINVNKTRSIAGKIIKNIWSELDKIGATSPSDRRRYLDAILVSLEQRGHQMVNRAVKKSQR
jgi:ribosomal protein S19E (S16A)